MGSMSIPRPAATVVLLREGASGLEALLTHRPASMAFAPDVHVFPGGRVDAADADPGLQARSVLRPEAAARALGGDLPPTQALATFIAAIREAFEEVGLLLADRGPEAATGGDEAAVEELAGARRRLLSDPAAFPLVAEELELRLRTDRLVPLSRWVTPPVLERRFDAQFFAAMAPDGVDVTLVGEEVTAHAWFRPDEALEQMGRGELGMWLPTSTTLVQLLHVSSFDEIGRRMAPGPLGVVVVDRFTEDIARIEMPAGGGVAGQPINAYLVGRERCVLIDPGDPVGPGLDRAVAEAERHGGRIVAIALTHPDPDHAAGAEALREQLGVEVLAGTGAGRHLPYPIGSVVDGAVVSDGDVPLRVVATPGPRPDHLAFVVGEGRFAVTGDLDGIRGARSILGPVDDAAWRASVERLRAIAPDATWLGGHPSIDLRP